MKLVIVLVVLVGTMFVMPLSHPADPTQSEKSKPSMEQKQSDKEKTKRGDTGSMGEEKTGGSGPSGTSGGQDVKAPQLEGAGSKKKQSILCRENATKDAIVLPSSHRAPVGRNTGDRRNQFMGRASRHCFRAAALALPSRPVPCTGIQS